MRTVAIDWSGAASGAEKKIWIAEARNGEIVRLENGRDRAQVGEWLEEPTQRDSAMMVGLDFAFALPSWFTESKGLSTAHELWALAEQEAEFWLRSCQSPFWGRPGTRRPVLPEHFRRTEREIPVTGGISAKSVFQIGGAGAVGTGSLRGMALLNRLSRAGYSIWPFDSPRYPCVIEIYPRLLTGPVKKSNPIDRADYLQARYPLLAPTVATLAASTEDAFDAAISALAMDAHRSRLASLDGNVSYDYGIEGQIWHPAV